MPIPMHSWHPIAVHLPLVALALAVLFDGLDIWKVDPRWRVAATLMWWMGLAGAVIAVGTGLRAYGKVDHSEPAHELMTLHRNLAFSALSVLVLTAVWRWRRPHSILAVLLGALGLAGLGTVGYLGGELVFRHALGVSTETLRTIARERNATVPSTMMPMSAGEGGATDTTPVVPPPGADTSPDGHTHTHR